VLGLILIILGPGAGPRTRADRPPKPAPIFPLETAWSLPLSSPPVAEPTLDAGQAYIALTEGALWAVDRDNGDRNWSIQADATIAPIAADFRVLVSGSSSVVAVSAASGDELWRVPLPAPATAHAIAGDLLVAATTGGVLLAIDLEQGSERWRRRLPASLMSGLAVATGWLAVSDDTGRVHAVDTASGTVRWSRSFSGSLSPPAVTADRVFVGSTTNRFWALRSSDGATIWQWRTGADVVGAATDGDLVYLLTLDNLVRALDVRSGNQRWKATLSTRPDAPPFLHGGVVIVSGVAPRIDGFDQTTGASLGSLIPISELAGPPAMSLTLQPFRTAMVAAAHDGRLLAYRPERLMLRDAVLAPLTALPGRRLTPDQIPAAGQK
jgi:outer membrane protein assembly factor BamB